MWIPNQKTPYRSTGDIPLSCTPTSSHQGLGGHHLNSCQMPPFSPLCHYHLSPGNNLLMNLCFHKCPLSPLHCLARVIFQNVNLTTSCFCLKSFNGSCYFLGKAYSMLGPTRRCMTWPISPHHTVSGHMQFSLKWRDPCPWVPQITAQLFRCPA